MTELKGVYVRVRPSNRGNMTELKKIGALVMYLIVMYLTPEACIHPYFSESSQR